MSFARLLNHSVRIYRLPEPETARGTLGSTSKKPLPITSATTRKNARPDQREIPGDLVDLGPGQQQGSKRRWFLDKSLPVEERDIISVTGGPEAGLRLLVENPVPVTNPQRVHHIEVICSVWKGTLGE